MRRKLATVSVLGLAGLVGAGVMTFPGVTAAESDQDRVAKREDNVAELVVVDDADDDDTNDRTRSRGQTRTRSGATADRGDHTADSADGVDATRDQTRTRDKSRDVSKDNTRENTRDSSRDNTRDKSRDASRS